MQVLRLLAARRPRRAVPTTITALSSEAAALDSEAEAENEDDDGPFFDLDFASVRASSSSAGSATSGSGSESDDAFTDLDLIISLHRSHSASPSYEALVFGGLGLGLAPPPPPPLLRLCSPKRRPSANAKAGARSLSFGARKAAFYGGRPSSARSSGSARSLRLFMESPADEGEEGDEDAAEGPRPAPYSRDAIRRCLTKISRRLRSVRGPRPREAAGPLRRLRKSRSASAAVAAPASSARRDDSLAEKQDGIASAIAHCKESLHRASLSEECESPLLRSRSDPGPGKCEAA